jgi:hypothetical protein
LTLSVYTDWLRGAVLPFVCICCPAELAEARDDGRYQNLSEETRIWVENLTNRHGKSCCSTADGFKPQAVEWNASANAYMVRLAEHWYEIPDYAVLREANRLGQAVVWYVRRTDGYPPPEDLIIMCFLPGPES